MDIDCRIPSLAHQEHGLLLPPCYLPSAFLWHSSPNRCFVEVQCGLYTGSEVPAFRGTWPLTPQTSILIWITQLFVSFHQWWTFLWRNFEFIGSTRFSSPIRPICPATFIAVFSLNSGIHFSLHCGNWHSTVGAIVNMAVWDWYKEAPVTPQAKLVCKAGRGCCLLCCRSLCRFAVGPFLIAFSYTARRLALHI